MTNWGTVITVAITQCISTITTFYMLRFLNNLHGNSGVSKIKRKVKKVIKDIDKGI